MRLIYDYPSFRTFLKDYYLAQKQKNPSFSYGVFAKQVGLASPSHIQLILSGKRSLTVHNVHRMGEALSLPQGELEYFEALVHANQAQTPQEKKYYETRLQQLHAGKPHSSARVKVSYLLSHGILPALLLSMEGKDLILAREAGDHFGYTPQETEQILNQLLKEGVVLLAAAQDGGPAVLRLSQRHLILHDKRARSQAQRTFLAEQLRLSARAFEKMYEQEGKFFAHTFTIRPEDAEQYVNEIKGLLERLTRLSDERSGGSVMQLNLQLFPYVRKLVHP